jgi:hypothetical protein
MEESWNMHGKRKGGWYGYLWETEGVNRYMQGKGGKVLGTYRLQGGEDMGIQYQRMGGG